jgi:hypothetical protein
MNAAMRKAANKCRDSFKHIAVAGTGLALSGLALADDPFTAAMTDATSKVTTYAGALVGLSAVAVVFMIGVKYVKKIKGAA